MGYTEDVFEALDIQDKLQTLYTSGTVFHTFLGEKLPDWKAAANLVRTIAENYELPYYTLSPTYSICVDHGYISGEAYTCPICGKKTEVYSRITGYYRPVQNWNDGKSQEYKDRKNYQVGEAAAKAAAPCTPCAAEEKPAQQKAADRYMLFVTSTCPNCRIIKPMLQKAGIPYEELNVADHADLAKAYDLKQAPTLVTLSGEEAKIYAGVAEIKAFLKEC